MAEKKTITLKIIETSDVHGCFFPYDFTEMREAAGSMARVSHYVDSLRVSHGRNVILLDNGDILQGQPVCYYYNYVRTDAKNIAAEIMNYMGYDACALGNHDIETGHGVYDKWMNEVRCPALAANVIDTQTDAPYSTPYVIMERNGIRIAVIGMLTPAIPNWLNERLWSGMRFEQIMKSARYWVDYVKKHERPDIVVGLFHSGWNGGISTIHYSEDETEQVARNVPGFDIIFFGHDHAKRNVTVICKDGNKVVCLNPSCNALAVAEATIEMTTDGQRVTGKRIFGEIRNLASAPVDTVFVNHFSREIEEVKSYVSRRIGRMETTIYTNDCYFGSAPFTDFIHNMQLSITGADVSFNAPLSFNIKIDEGDVCVGDLFKLYRYENQIYVLNMTGREILDYLEMSYGLWVNTMKSPADHIMLLDEAKAADRQRYGFKNLAFNFDSAAGIDYTVDVTKPQGHRIAIQGMSDGRPFYENKWYKVAMNSYRGNGGGELLTKGAGIPKDSLEGRIVYQSDKDQRHYIMQEIERRQCVTPKANNNWCFVPEDWTEEALKRDRKLIFGDK